MYSGTMTTFPLEVIACPQQCVDGKSPEVQPDEDLLPVSLVYWLRPLKPCKTCGGVGKVRIQKLEGAE